MKATNFLANFLGKLEHGTLWLHLPVKVVYLLLRLLCLHCFKHLFMVFPELVVSALLSGCIHCVSSMTHTRKVSATLFFLRLQKCLNVQVPESRVRHTVCCQDTLHMIPFKNLLLRSGSIYPSFYPRIIKALSSIDDPRARKAAISTVCISRSRKTG